MQMQFEVLVENVMLQSNTDLAWFNNALRARPIAADAAAFGVISRPRAWWIRVDWTPITHIRIARCAGTRSKGCLGYSLQNNDVDKLDMPGVTFAETVKNGQQLFSRAHVCVNTMMNNFACKESALHGSAARALLSIFVCRWAKG